MKIFLYSYFYDNSWWSLEISAYSKEDADKIIKGSFGIRYDGILEEKIYVPSQN